MASPRPEHRLVDMFCGTLFLMFLTIVQAILAFAFFDASWLDSFLLTFPMYASGGGGLSVANFYQGSDITLCGDLMPGSNSVDECVRLPLINFLASICGLILLGFEAFDEEVESLVVPCPAFLFFNPTFRNRWPGIGGVAWRIFSCALQQLAWVSRFLFVPVMVHAGAAFALVSSFDAQAIVLNSLAAGFIFQLDNDLFGLASGRQKEHYRTAKPFYPTKPRLAHTERRLKYATGYLLALTNATFAILLYLKEVGPSEGGWFEWGRPFPNWYFWLALFFHARSALYVVAQGCTACLYLGVSRKAATISTLMLVVTVGSSFSTYHLIYRRGMEQYLGSSNVFYPLPGSPQAKCLFLEAHCDPYTIYTGWPENVTELGPSYTYESSWYGADSNGAP
uniref:Uncharacterized protein n=1 Tax=Prymnesium polylepis TaxID=72548 RepID=A0A7S4M1B7_9EUKA